MFSPANTKLKKLYEVKKLKSWLTDNRKIYSFDLLSGHACPFAKNCKAKVEVHSKVTGKKLKILRSAFNWVAKRMKRSVVDGPDTEFRCFSASQEALFSGTFTKRLNNYLAVKDKSYTEILDLLKEYCPENAGIVRIHVSGDFFNAKYFAAWMDFAKSKPDTLFYAYTKSLPYYLKYRNELPPNFVITASRGGSADELIDSHGLREAVVVHSEDAANRLGLQIDYDDSHACRPDLYKQSFALLLHGLQPAGSAASVALQKLKRQHNKV